MALIVEDGTGLSTAESYISVADADAYFLDRGNAAWAALSNDAKEQALRKGADYLLAVYDQRWKGQRVTFEQAMSWPRYDVVVNQYVIPSNVIPVALKRANAELALRASTAELLADVGGQVLSETVGPISVTYAEGARQNTKFALVENMLASLMQGGRQIPVARA